MSLADGIALKLAPDNAGDMFHSSVKPERAETRNADARAFNELSHMTLGRI
jgi:hypothetical protein